MLQVAFSLKYYNDEGLKNAPNTLAKSVTGALEGIGKRLRTGAQARMRRDTKAAISSLKIEITGSGLDKELFVGTDLIQAFVDANGIRPKKVFPNFRVGSPLYNWASRKLAGKPSKVVQTGNFRKGRPRKATGLARIGKVRGKASGTPLNSTKRQKMRNTDARRFAYLTALSVYNKGIKPTYWNTKALEANRQAVINDLTNGILRAVNKINRG